MTDIVLSTTPSLFGFDIEEYIGVESADFAISIKAGQAIVNSLAEGLGMRDVKHKTGIDIAREKCLLLLEKKAEFFEANAVIGITMGIHFIPKKDVNLIIMTGTLVKVVPSKVSFNPQQLTMNSPVELGDCSVITPMSSDVVMDDIEEVQIPASELLRRREHEPKPEEGNLSDEALEIVSSTAKEQEVTVLTHKEPVPEEKPISPQQQKGQAMARLALISNAFVAPSRCLEQPEQAVLSEESK